jgi:hypothetical protein
MTLPAINRSRAVHVLVSGSRKKVPSRAGSVMPFPVVWWADRPAAH